MTATLGLGASRADSSQQQSRKDIAYQSLRERLLSDGFAPGELIDEAREAELLDMSRTPVREALLKLESEGIVEVLPRRGIRVIPLTRTEIQEAIVLLTALETTAVGLIAQSQPTRESLAEMVDAVSELKHALRDDARERWLRADENFHRSLLILCGNHAIMETGLRYRDRIRRGHFVASRLLPRTRHVQSTEQHARVLEALLSDAPEEAVNIHHAQRNSGESDILDVLIKAGLDNL